MLKPSGLDSTGKLHNLTILIRHYEFTIIKFYETMRHYRNDNKN